MAANCDVSLESRAGTEVCCLRAGDSGAAVVPAWGNNCIAFTSAARPILEAVDFETVRQKPSSYGIPILFPFPNRIRDGAFDFRGEHFVVDPPRHGFVRDKPWKVEGYGARDAEGAWLTCSLDARDYSEAILRQFPFPFRLEVTYRLHDGALELLAVAQNTGERSMPCGLGIHPYFELPAEGTLEVPARRRWELADSLPTGKLLPVEGPYDLRQPAPLTGFPFDDIFTELIADAQGVTRCRLADRGARQTTVVEFARREFPHVVVYTPPVPRHAICIEPNSCLTDAFNLQNRGIAAGVLTLEPGERRAFRIVLRSVA